MRVPFLVRWPGVSEPQVSDLLVGSVDIYPTILEAAGIDAPAGLHGRSLKPALGKSRDLDWRTTLVAEFHYHMGIPFFPRRAITDGRYKLIHNLLAGQSKPANGIDGDEAWEFAQRLPETHPARLAIERLADPPQWELYDLRKDPVEFNNIALAADTGITIALMGTSVNAVV